MILKVITTFFKNNNKIQDVKLLLEQGVVQIQTAEHWSNFIRHVRDEEKKIWLIA